MNLSRPLSHLGPARALGVLAAVAGLATLLAACGGSSAASSGSTSTTVPASLANYRQCLTSHGVPARVADARGRFGRAPGAGNGSAGSGSTPTTRPGSATAGPRPTIPAQYRTAFTDCRSLLPAGGGFGRNAANNPQFAAYRNCLQLHGVTLPTRPSGGSTPGSSVPVGGAAGGGFANNPTFQAARKACAALMPTGSGFGGPTTTVAP